MIPMQKNDTLFVGKHQSVPVGSEMLFMVSLDAYPYCGRSWTPNAIDAPFPRLWHTTSSHPARLQAPS